MNVLVHVHLNLNCRLSNIRVEILSSLKQTVLFLTTVIANVCMCVKNWPDYFFKGISYSVSMQVQGEDATFLKKMRPFHEGLSLLARSTCKCRIQRFYGRIT